MTLVDLLTQYNAWRRGECDDPQPNPTQLGKDIDEAIAKLAAAEKLAEASDDLVLQGGYDKSTDTHWVRGDDIYEFKKALTDYQSQTKETP